LVRVGWRRLGALYLDLLLVSVPLALFLSVMRSFTDGLLDYDAYHLFGHRVGGPAAKLVLVATALGFAWSAVALFRRPAYGPVVILGVPVLALLNDFTSLPLLPSTMAAAMTRAQARHGGRTLPLDAEAWAGLLLEVQVLHLIVLLGVVAASRRYFARDGMEEPRQIVEGGGVLPPVGPPDPRLPLAAARPPLAGALLASPFHLSRRTNVYTLPVCGSSGILPRRRRTYELTG
jgi:hypothetical protein